MDTNYTVNETVLIRMADYLINDSSFAEDYFRFTSISDRRFYIDSVTGDIKIQRQLDPLRLHYVRVYLRYNGTVKSTKRLYSATTSVLVRIYTKGKYIIIESKPAITTHSLKDNHQQQNYI